MFVNFTSVPQEGQHTSDPIFIVPEAVTFVKVDRNSQGNITGTAIGLEGRVIYVMETTSEVLDKFEQYLDEDSDNPWSLDVD